MTKRTTIIAGTASILFALVLTCIIVLLLIPGVQLLPFYSLEPQDLLPATGTIFLMKNPTLEELQKWKTVFPALDDVMSDTPLEAIALMQTDERAMRSVGFQRKSGGWDGKSCEIGPYRVIVGSEQEPAFAQASTGRDSCPMVGEHGTFLTPGPRLSDDRGWRSLGRLPKESWTFVRRESLPAAEKLPQRIFQGILLSNATHLLTFHDSGNTVVRSWPTTPLSTLSEASLPASPLASPETIFAFGNLEEVFAALERDLSQDDRIVFEGVLLQKLEDLSGPLVSMRHELLPLLALDARILTGTTASGAVAVLLTGTAQKRTDIALHIDALHRSFRLRHPNVELLKYAFDNGRFPFRTLRLAENAFGEVSEQIRGWVVTMSRDASDSAMLVTAINDQQTAISNDPELLRRFLMEERDINILLPSSKRPIASRLVTGMLIPNVWLGSSLLWMPKTGKSVIAIEQAEELRIVHMSKLKIEN